MHDQLQKAAFWKRLSAWLFDSIIVMIVAIGVGFLVSEIVQYDSYSTSFQTSLEKYEAEYSVRFDMDADEYAGLTEEEKGIYDAAYKALISDDEAVRSYNMTVSLSVVIVIISLFVSVMAWEFVLPTFLGNGQTLGKKIFGICLIKPNCVKANNLQLFVRALLGKYAVEIMIPVYTLIMLFWNMLNMIPLVLTLAVLISQIILLMINKNGCLIHDLISGTAVVDYGSQKIFASEEELLEYKKKRHLESAQNKPY